MSQSTFLDGLLNLVDRYWNGSKSLHAHSKFQGRKGVRHPYFGAFLKVVFFFGGGGGGGMMYL